MQPVYETLSGWRQPISDIRRFEALPEPAGRYVERIQELAGIPISMISVGPEREQAIRV